MISGIIKVEVRVRREASIYARTLACVAGAKRGGATRTPVRTAEIWNKFFCFVLFS